MLLERPRSPLFPYTTLFRSPLVDVDCDTALFRSASQKLSEAQDRPDEAGERCRDGKPVPPGVGALAAQQRSEEHTSELQSQSNLVCRLLLEKKKNEYPHTSN